MSDEESKLIKRVINAAMDAADSLSVSRFVSLAKDKELRLANTTASSTERRRRRVAGRVSYRLGAYCGGRLYLFTELGEFRSVAEAANRWLSAPRNGRAVVVEDADIGWGIKQRIFSTDGDLLCPPRGGKREGAGRKPLGDRAGEHLHIRVSAERLAAYREAATRADKTLSEWVQLHLDKAAQR